VHMDMVGGEPETKAVFHVTRGPMSLPSFVQDVAWAFAEWVNEESYQFAATGKAAYPLVSAEGGKEPLRAEYSAYTMGSDHDVYQDSSFGIPAIYLNDWPDRFIHTNLDTAANIDATKLKRAGFIGAASGYFLSNLTSEGVPKVKDEVDSGSLLRDSSTKFRTASLPLREASCALHFALANENQRLTQLEQFVGGKEEYVLVDGPNCPTGGREAIDVDVQKWRRKGETKGPMTVFGYDYFEAEWGKRGHTSKPKLLEHEGLWGGGEEYAYEVLNFADGNRNAQEIRDAVSAEYGPVDLGMVVEYLKALEEVGVVEEVK
jgi:aminopeptidase YwaD